jgi:hypothetical protein
MRVKFKKPWSYSPHGWDYVGCDAGAELDVPDSFARIAVDEGFAVPAIAVAPRGRQSAEKDADKGTGKDADNDGDKDSGSKAGTDQNPSGTTPPGTGDQDPPKTPKPKSGKTKSGKPKSDKSAKGAK